ncbi:Anaphase-promoting complex subunit 10 [Hordeum vulgare]|nr:Anaphase-promoting complex subunit 10 [Hordeum vulgare]
MESDGEEEAAATLTPGTAAAASAAGRLKGCPELTVEGDMREMAKTAAWSVSSCKPGNGVASLRDDSLDTYWQHDVLNVSEGLLQELGIYLLSFDRPGYCESDAHPAWTEESIVVDIAELADNLQLGAGSTSWASPWAARSCGAASNTSRTGNKWWNLIFFPHLNLLTVFLTHIASRAMDEIDKRRLSDVAILARGGKLLVVRPAGGRVPGGVVRAVPAGPGRRHNHDKTETQTRKYVGL